MQGELELEEISGFKSPGELSRFKSFLSDAITGGELQEISADPTYHVGEIYGGRWFILARDKSVWRLIEPDPPFTGLFQRVNL